MKKVEHVWQKRANKIGHENDVEIVERYLFYLQNSFSKKIWDSNSSQNEELYAWNFMQNFHENEFFRIKVRYTT